MNDNVLSIAHKGKGKDTLTEIGKLPRHLCDDGKKAYKDMGELLIKADRLKAYMLPALEVFAAAYAQWVFACKEINRLNKEKHGRGYIQRFAGGARNISPEITCRDKASADMLRCSKQFGLDPRSEKELKAAVDSGQTNLFDELNKALNSN